MKVEVTQQISAPIERVYAVFTDLPRAAERISGIESVHMLTDQLFDVGTRWKETRVMMGKSATETIWITAADEPNSYIAEAESCGTHYTSTFLFKPVDGGTQVSMAFEGRPVTFLSGLLSPLGILMKGTIRKILAKDFADLAAACESESEPVA